VNYARERIQGRTSSKPWTRAPLGSHHPASDVRRMLMLMKVYVEGMAQPAVLRRPSGRPPDHRRPSREQAKYQGMIDFLIPIAKGMSRRGPARFATWGSRSTAVTLHPRISMEQLLRDCRITPIYEGTNGIQAMDLLGRKLASRDSDDGFAR